MERGTLSGRVQFRIEQLLVRGARYRLLVVAAVIGLISIVGGALVMLTHHDFANFREAVWWAFLRLTDPGYLGDDVGTGRRIISTILTVLGYVVFLGALVAILTQWLNSTIERLELGLSPVRMQRHIVILGWTSRTPRVAAALMDPSDRLDRWLASVDIGRPRLVILVPRVTPEHVQRLKDELGSHYREDDIILRSGSPLQLEHLERVDAFHAAAIVMPGELFDTDAGSAHDARVLKVLLSMTAHRRSQTGRLPRFVAEISDPSRIHAARKAYDGPLELLPTDLLVSRLIAGAARQPGYSQLVLSSVGSAEPLVTMVPPARGDTSAAAAAKRVSPDVLIGTLVKQGDGFAALAVADPKDPVHPDDLLAVAPPRTIRGASHQAWHGRPPPRRVLVLGWNAKAPDLIADFAGHPGPKPQELCVVSRVAAADRVADLAAHDLAQLGLPVRHVEGNDASPRALAAADPSSFDVVILLASETWRSGEEADADTIAAHVALQELFEHADTTPHCIVELVDPDNVALLRDTSTEVVTGGPFLSYSLANTVLAPPFAAVVRGLLVSTDHGIRFEPVPKELRADGFVRMQSEVAARGGVLVGLRQAGVTRIAPRPGDPITFGDHDELLVFGPFGEG